MENSRPILHSNFYAQRRQEALVKGVYGHHKWTIHCPTSNNFHDEGKVKILLRFVYSSLYQSVPQLCRFVRETVDPVGNKFAKGDRVSLHCLVQDVS
jgi:hypothetical protein